MKKAALALTILAALTVTAVAIADEKQEQGPPSTPGSTPPSTSGTPTTPAAPNAPPSQMPEGATSTGGCPQTTATTTITAAETMAPPMPPPKPPEQDVVTLKQSVRPNRPLLYTGGIMFLSSYAATAAATTMRDIRDGSGVRSLYLPVAGPWMHLANTKGTSLFDTWLIGSSGLLQGAGVVLGALSLIVPERIPAVTIQAGDVKMNVTATSYGSGSAGIGAVGQF